MPEAEAGQGARARRPAVFLSLALAAQACLFYSFSGAEAVPALRPLKELPALFGGWSTATEGVLEKEVLDVLRADDTVSRVYAQARTGHPASLFVAYFKTQRTGQAPHSPKNCLPGSGWAPSTSDMLTVSIPGLREPIQVNRYVVSRGEEKSVVLYWYQTPTRVIASEYKAKVFLVVDSVRYRRSDTALVRVVSPVAGGDEEAATKAAVDFLQSFFLPLRQFLPS